MTYRSHILLQMGGPFFGSEIWSIGLRMTIGSTLQDQVPDNILDLWEQWTVDNVDDVAQDCATWIESPDALISAAAKLGYVKLNVIGPDGRYRNTGETVQFDFPVNDLPSGGRTPTFPQATCVVSLLTDRQRGRAHRGRVYTPTGAFTLSSGVPYISAAETAQVAGAFSAFINNLNNQPGLDVNNPRVVVCSELGNPGPSYDVTSVAVGNVIDTQRRRRGALAETYATAPVVIN